MSKTITVNATYPNTLPLNKLKSIQQLEMLYKATIYTLREEGISVPEKHESLSYELSDNDAVDLVDTLDVLHDLIMSHDKYNELKKQNSIMDYAKSKVVTVDSLDVLEQQLNLSEQDIEMGYEFYLDDTLELVVEYAMNENSIDTLVEFEQAIAVKSLEFYYAEHDRKFVAVFS